MNPVAIIDLPRDVVNAAMECYPAVFHLLAGPDDKCTTCGEISCDHKDIRLKVFDSCSCECGNEKMTTNAPWKNPTPKLSYTRQGEAPNYIYKEPTYQDGSDFTRESHNGGQKQAWEQMWNEGHPGFCRPSRKNRGCVYCKSNKETIQFQRSHTLYDLGIVTCPILRRFICPICKATGDFAHTVKYCPFQPTAAAHEYKNTINAFGHQKIVKY